jgi:hypothetical protein
MHAIMSRLPSTLILPVALDPSGYTAFPFPQKGCAVHSPRDVCLLSQALATDGNKDYPDSPGFSKSR